MKYCSFSVGRKCIATCLLNIVSAVLQPAAAVDVAPPSFVDVNAVRLRKSERLDDPLGSGDLRFLDGYRCDLRLTCLPQALVSLAYRASGPQRQAGLLIFGKPVHRFLPLFYKHI